tara:strand:- start:213 stop:362 length:150 start_codon:yes stop_codon:yes gene_type:complete
MSKDFDEINPHPLDTQPSIRVGSKEFEEMLLGVMINKHNDPEEDFDLNA